MEEHKLNCPQRNVTCVLCRNVYVFSEEEVSCFCYNLYDSSCKRVIILYLTGWRNINLIGLITGYYYLKMVAIKWL